MSLLRRAGRRRSATIALASAATISLALASAGSAQAAPASAQSGPSALYIVEMAGAPLASYDGSVQGYAATKPVTGQKLNAHSSQAKAYGDHLKAKQTDVLRANGVDTRKAVYQYETTFNGVAVNLTAAQAQKLQHAPGVAAVFKNQTVTVDTPVTPSFLGLTGSNGVWQKQFGGDKNAGNGVIIADIDTGFWPESPSFAPLPSPRSDDATIAAKWHGTCDAGLDHPVTCNNKVIGARWYRNAGDDAPNSGEFMSPRDYDGHGSHTASTAAGEHVDNVAINGVPIGDVEGVAPGARLAIYKVLYETPNTGTASGSSADIVAAIDDAVSDGADVINYSVGDNADNFSAVELAFLQAAAAGVFVSAAAGNAGPGAGTVDNAMPWEATVAAGTHDGSYTKTVTLGNGATYSGIGVGPAVPSSPLIDAATAAGPGQTAANATLCVIGSLDPAKVAGKIVLCQRGVNNRIDKSAAVKQAGGVGMILWNPTPNSLNADFHFVPSIHVDTPSGTAIKAYAAGANPTASLSAGVLTKVEAPAVASFSSRGPSPSSGGDLIKPDVMGPGNDVVAAVSPVNHSGNLYDTESGTSMSTPHIAGVAALLISKHPDWGPMTVKSAIMTTATTLDNQGKPIQGQSGNANPLDYGSGEVVPAAAFNPGLAYNSTPTEWLQYSCGIGVHLSLSGSDVCDVVGTIAPNQLNYPSIAFGSLAGSDTVTRTVTNVTKQWGLYAADVKAPAGYKITVSPPILLVGPGKSTSFKIKVTRTDAAFGSYSFGSITWRDLLGHKVYSPIAIQSTALAAPSGVSGTGTSGSTALPLKSGYTGTLKASAFGLVTDHVDQLSLTKSSTAFNPAAPKVSASTGRVDITLPAGAKLAKFSTFASDYAAGTDIDVYAYAVRADGTLAQIGQSSGATADESISVTEPGTYAVFVDLFNNPTAGALDVKLHSWIVNATNAGNFTASPASQSVTLGAAATVTASWSGLTAGGHYLGVVEFSDGTNVLEDTVVTVNP